MKKILVIGASNSKKSINKTLATYIANQIEDATVTITNWDNLELPLYSVDLENEEGVPKNAEKFKALIDSSEGIIISLAEHNSLPSAAFKNLWDWVSRLDKKFWGNKPIFLAATSPGKRGGKSVLQTIKPLMPHFGGNVIVDFSLPLFNENFQHEKISNKELKKELEEKVKKFQQAI